MIPIYEKAQETMYNSTKGWFIVPSQVPSDNHIVPQGLKNETQQNKKHTSPVPTTDTELKMLEREYIII